MVNMGRSSGNFGKILRNRLGMTVFGTKMLFALTALGGGALFGILSILLASPFSENTVFGTTSEMTKDSYFLSATASDQVMLRANETSLGSLIKTETNLLVKTNSGNGYKAYLSMIDSSSNKLMLENDTTGANFIAPTTTTEIENRTWGYSLDGVSFKAVPLLNSGGDLVASSAAPLGSEGQTTKIYYGAKVDSRMKSGKYTGRVLYTVVGNASDAALDTISKIVPNTVNYSEVSGKKVEIFLPLMTNRVYGLAEVMIGDKKCENSVLAITTPGEVKIRCDLPVMAAGEYDVVVVLSGINKVYSKSSGIKYVASEFSYTGGMQEFTAPIDGVYKLEAWGAQGGSAEVLTKIDPAEYGRKIGGRGGYSVGAIRLQAGEKIYVGVGGTPVSDSINKSFVYSTDNYTGVMKTCDLSINLGGQIGGGHVGGYNGGGNTCGHLYGYAGGGATHMGFLNKELYKYKNNQQDVIIVAGGGGGAGTRGAGYGAGHGGNGGGVMGGSGTFNSEDSNVDGPNSVKHFVLVGNGGTNNSGGVPRNVFQLYNWLELVALPGDPHYFYGATLLDWGGGFGFGGGFNTENSVNLDKRMTIKKYGTIQAGGGGGYYGGASALHSGAGGGSGYIGHSRLMSASGVTKHMVGYKVQANSEVNLRTESVTVASDQPVADQAKNGNGYAKITLIAL